jgi:hypothetical protein
LTLLTLAVPVADVVTVPAHPLRAGGGDMVLFFGVDGVLLVLASLFAFCARRIARYEGPVAKRRAAPAGAARATTARPERQAALT